MLIFYLVGAALAFICGLIIYIREKDKKNLQIEALALITIMSWVSVILIVWKIFLKELIK